MFLLIVTWLMAWLTLRVDCTKRARFLLTLPVSAQRLKQSVAAPSVRRHTQPRSGAAHVNQVACRDVYKRPRRSRRGLHRTTAWVRVASRQRAGAHVNEHTRWPGRPCTTLKHGMCRSRSHNGQETALAALDGGFELQTNRLAGGTKTVMQDYRVSPMPFIFQGRRISS